MASALHSGGPDASTQDSPLSLQMAPCKAALGKSAVHTPWQCRALSTWRWPRATAFILKVLVRGFWLFLTKLMVFRQLEKSLKTQWVEFSVQFHDLLSHQGWRMQLHIFLHPRTQRGASFAAGTAPCSLGEQRGAVAVGPPQTLRASVSQGRLLFVRMSSECLPVSWKFYTPAVTCRGSDCRPEVLRGGRTEFSEFYLVSSLYKAIFFP